MTIPEATKPIIDVAATTTLVAVLTEVITALAALFTVLWYALRFYEKWTGKPFHETPLVMWWKNKKVK